MQYKTSSSLQDSIALLAFVAFTRTLPFNMTTKTSAQDYFEGMGLNRQPYVLSPKRLENQLKAVKPFWRGDGKFDLGYVANASAECHPSTHATILHAMAGSDPAYKARLGSALKDGKLSAATHGRRALRNSPCLQIVDGDAGCVPLSKALEPVKKSDVRDTRNASIKRLEDLVRRDGDPARVTKLLVDAVETDQANLNTVYRAIRLIDTESSWKRVSCAVGDLVAQGVITGKLNVSRVVVALAHSQKQLTKSRLECAVYERLCVALTRRGLLAGSVMVPMAVDWLQAAAISGDLSAIQLAVKSIAQWNMGAEFPVYVVTARVLRESHWIEADDQSDLSLSGVAMQLHAYACTANGSAGTPCYAARFGSDFAMAMLMHADQKIAGGSVVRLTELTDALDTIARLGYRCDPGGMLLAFVVACQTGTGQSRADVLATLAEHSLFSIGHVPVYVLVHLLQLTNAEPRCASTMWSIALRLSADELAHYNQDPVSCRCTIDFDTTFKTLVAFCQPSALDRECLMHALFQRSDTPPNALLARKLTAFLFVRP